MIVREALGSSFVVNVELSLRNGLTECSYSSHCIEYSVMLNALTQRALLSHSSITSTLFSMMPCMIPLDTLCRCTRYVYFIKFSPRRIIIIKLPCMDIGY
jgi:hypothetical protein